MQQQPNTFPITQLKRRFMDEGLSDEIAHDYAKVLFKEGCTTMKILGVLLDSDLVEFGIKPQHAGKLLTAVQKETDFWKRVDLVKTFDVAMMKSKMIALGLSDAVAALYAKSMVDRGCNTHRLYCQLTEQDVKECGVLLPNHVTLILNDVHKEKTRKPTASSSSSRTVPATVAQLQGHSSFVLTIAFNVDGAIAYSAGYDYKIIVWDMGSFHTMGELIGHTAAVYDLMLSPNQHWLASASEDCTVRLWNTDGDEEDDRVLRGHVQAVHTVCFSSDSERVVSGSGDCSIIVWSIENVMLHHFVHAHGDLVSKVLLLPNTVLVSTSYDTVIRTWNIETKTEIMSFNKGHTHRIFSIAYDPIKNLIMTGSQDKSIVVWSMESGKMKNKVVDAHVNCVFSLDCSSRDSILLSGGGNGEVKAWEVPSLELLKTIVAHSWWVYCVRFIIGNDKDQWVSCGDDKVIKIWHKSDFSNN